jgi:cytochrome c oxidase assembly protein subunit 11
MSDDSVYFRAVHSIVPMAAAKEFQLIQCFCFEDQTLGPRETRELPVYFALSPRFPTDVNEIVLNYTLFPRDPKKRMPVPAEAAN